jgi:DnaA family protein
MRVPHPQLPLPVAARETRDFAAFVPGPNAEAMAAVRAAAPGVLYLWGAPGSGKTHLLQAATPSGVYLELTPDLPPEAVDGLDACGLLALDAIEAVAGIAAWEQALFALINRVRDGGASLLLASRAAPGALTFALPDLRSRIAGALVFGLKPLDDAAKRAVLTLRAQQRGMGLPLEVADYLLQHSGRELPALLAALEALDRAALSGQRRLTLPLARQALADLAAGSELAV